MNEDRTKRKLTAIFSADVVGYSRLMEADEAWTIQNLEENKKLISRLIGEYQGRVIDAPGDNLLAEFNSAINAVECAVKIQQELKKKNDHLIESNRMHFRIGINLGDVVEEDGRIYGNGVNIAARLEGLTDPGGICISRRTYDHVKTRLDLGYEYLGEHNVKNISEPVRVYRVLMGADDAGKVIGEKKASKMVSRRLAMTTLIALIIIAAGSLIWMYSHQSRKTEQASELEQAPIVADAEKTKKTIAVLPFDDLSPEKDQEYFVLGLSEEILNSLAQINNLTVIAKTSSFSFRDTNKTIQEIANALGVENILEGSVRKAGNVLRITAQLICATDGAHLWSKIYDRELKDIFEVQEDIATAVADELKVALGIETTRRILGGTDNLEAYELYLTAGGQDYSGEHPKAIESINAAIALAPDFALAWALKAQTHNLLITMGPTERAAEELDLALIAAQKAIELEPALAGVYNAVVGDILLMKGDFVGAGLALRKAAGLQNDSWPYLNFEILKFNSTVGYLKENYELSEAVRQTDPLDRSVRTMYMEVSGMLGDMQQAEKEYERCRALFEGQWDLGNQSITFLRLRLGKVVPLEDIVFSEPICDVAKEYLDSPGEGLAQLLRIYRDDTNLSSAQLMYISCWAAYFGDSEFAMDALDRGARIDATGLHFIWYPVMHEVRQLPRFKEYVKKIGLTGYWNKFGWPDICRPLDNGGFECD